MLNWFACLQHQAFDRDRYNIYMQISQCMFCISSLSDLKSSPFKLITLLINLSLSLSSTVCRCQAQWTDCRLWRSYKNCHSFILRCHLKQTDPCHFVLTLPLHYLSRSSCSWLKNTCSCLQRYEKKKKIHRKCVQREIDISYFVSVTPQLIHLLNQDANHKCSACTASLRYSISLSL